MKNTNDQSDEPTRQEQVVKTYTRFHPGEVQLHAEAGTDTDAYEAMSIDMMIPDLKPNEAAFVDGLTFSYAGSVDADGRPWASPLLASNGRLFDVETPTRVVIDSAVAEGDPLRTNIDATGQLSVLYLEPRTRRRSKSIGVATVAESGIVTYDMTRNFGLCPKYIFKRNHEVSSEANVAKTSTRTNVLSEKDVEQLKATDTIFFASHSPHGADVTHRGGSPGFVQVHGTNRLEIPDYFGNGMFNTFGNLVLDNRLAVTDTDFATGRTIHMTGRANVELTGDAEPARRVLFDIEEVIVTYAAIGIWTDVEPSRYSPPVG